MGRQRNISDQQILEVARECFLEGGPGLSTTVIADRLGISHALLFQRFGTKEQLLRAALDIPDNAPWFKAIEMGPSTGPGAGDPQVQLYDLIRHTQDTLEEMLPKIAVLRSAGIHPRDLCESGHEPLPIRVHRALSGWFERAVQQKMFRPCNHEHVAYILLGALQIRSFNEHMLGKTYSAEDRTCYLLTMMDLLWKSLRQENHA